MGFDDRARLRYLPCSLEKEAWSSFTSMPKEKVNTFEKAMEALDDRYSAKVTGDILFSQLFHETQKPSQPVFEYSCSLIDKMNSLEINDPKLRLQIYIKGLRPEFRNDVIRARPKTIPDAQSLALILESTKASESSELAAVKRAMDDLTVTLKETTTNVVRNDDNEVDRDPSKEMGPSNEGGRYDSSQSSSNTYQPQGNHFPEPQGHHIPSEPQGNYYSPRPQRNYNQYRPQGNYSQSGPQNNYNQPRFQGQYRPQGNFNTYRPHNNNNQYRPQGNNNNAGPPSNYNGQFRPRVPNDRPYCFRCKTNHLVGRHVDGTGPPQGQLYCRLHNSYTHGDFNCFQQKNNSQFQNNGERRSNLN